MTFEKLGLAAVALAAFIGLSGNAAYAAPFAKGSAFSDGSGIVQAQYHDRGRRFGPPRRICRWETVERRVRGRIIKERVQRCRVVRR
ncbi:hypothetical protein [Microvirga sp. 17 mud 1-3]|uniref:hypothetical protein n=1 Tax=Microvirga sp. 17 mud 1-3 TaxID=2082949 RepID=UPI000D6D20A0|nr:hypothetical protein [Microvirga sp. 17 mud 1-3]AWM87587.1 hypothetical protein C4E04_13145 [Microvirga sp. 17 mud 1-3]